MCYKFMNSSPLTLFPCHLQETIAQISSQGQVASLDAAVERLIESHVDSPSGDPPLVSARTAFAATAAPAAA